MAEIVIDDFSIQEEVSGEKGNPPFSIADIRNLYIEGGNLHAIKVTPETIPVYPATVLPSIEVRGGPMEYFKYDQYWLMKWLDEDYVARFYPIANLLGVVTVSQDTEYLGTNIYTVASSDRDPVSMFAKSSWWAPAGIGPLSKQSGSGDRAWTGLTASSDIIKQSACVYGGQIYTSVDSGVTWTARDSNRNWSDISGEQTGTNLIACVYGGYIYTSTDSGATWTQRATTKNWIAVGISSDGTKMVGLEHGGSLWYSSDSGANWTERNTIPSGWDLWADMSCSSDLAVIYACEYGGKIVKSTDYGVTWSILSPSNAYWKMISCSGDGSVVVAITVNASGYLYRSIDSGATWSTSTFLSTANWWSCSVSYDGTTLVANVEAGVSYKSVTWDEWNAITIPQGSYYFVMSSDGVSATCVQNGCMAISNACTAVWTQRDSARAWSGIDCSYDGKYAIACVSSGYLYVSSDYGATWTQKASSTTWTGVCCSSDGSIMYACRNGGTMYKSSDYGANWAAIGATTPGSISATAIDCSDDGSVVAVTISTGVIYVSIDSGANWTSRASSKAWTRIKMSSSGLYMYAYNTTDGALYKSEDTGTTWANILTYGGCDALSVNGSGATVIISLSLQDKTSTDYGVTFETDNHSGTYYTGRDSWRAYDKIADAMHTTQGFPIVHHYYAEFWTLNHSTLRIRSTDLTWELNKIVASKKMAFAAKSGYYVYTLGLSASTVSAGSYSGYVYSSSLVPNRTKYILDSYLAKIDSTHIETDIVLDLGKYCIFAENDLDYITDIINSDTVEHMGVFYDNMDDKLIRVEVVSQVETVGSLFTGTDFSANNDFIYSTPNVEQFGSRMAMANVWEMDGTDLCTNGDFASSGSGWNSVGTVTYPASSGRGGARCCLFSGTCTLSQKIADYNARLFFYAKGDITSLSGDFSIEADTVNSGWFRIIMKDQVSGIISISKIGGEDVYIDDVTCYQITEQAASIYISGAGTYQEFIIGGDIVKFPSNSRGINGIKASGEYLYVIKNDVTGTIAETGDPQNPFHTVESAFPIGGRYPFKVGNYFGIIRDENSELIVMLFDGSGYQTINEYWDAPYNKLTFAVPNILDYPMMTAQFGDKWILSQYQETEDKYYGIVLSGYNKIGGFQMGRMYGGMFTGQIVGAFTPEYLATVLVSCGNTNKVKRFRGIKVYGETDIDYDVDVYPAIVGTPIAMVDNNSYGLNFTSRKARFDISPDASAAISDILINQITLTFDEVMPDIKH